MTVCMVTTCSLSWQPFGSVWQLGYRRGYRSLGYLLLRCKGSEYLRSAVFYQVVNWRSGFQSHGPEKLPLDGPLRARADASRPPGSPASSPTGAAPAPASFNSIITRNASVGTVRSHSVEVIPGSGTGVSMPWANSQTWVFIARIGSGMVGTLLSRALRRADSLPMVSLPSG